MKLPRDAGAYGFLSDYLQRMSEKERATAISELQVAFTTEAGANTLSLLEKAVLDRTSPLNASDREVSNLNACRVLVDELRRLATYQKAAK